MPPSRPWSCPSPGPDCATPARLVSGRRPHQHSASTSVSRRSFSPAAGGGSNLDGNPATALVATPLGIAGIGVGSAGSDSGAVRAGGSVASPSNAFGAGVGLGGLDAVAVASPHSAIEAALRAAAAAAASAAAAATAQRSPRSRSLSPASWRRPVAPNARIPSSGSLSSPPAVAVDGVTAAPAAAAAASVPAAAVRAEVGGMLPLLSLPASERSRAVGWRDPPLEGNHHSEDVSTEVVAQAAVAVAASSVSGVGRVLAGVGRELGSPTVVTPNGCTGGGVSMPRPVRVMPGPLSPHITTSLVSAGQDIITRADSSLVPFAADLAPSPKGEQPSMETPVSATKLEEESRSELKEEFLVGPGGWTKDGTWTMREMAHGALVLGGSRLVAVELGGMPDPTSLREVSLASNALSEVNLTPLALCPALEALVLNANELAAIDLTPLAACPKLERLWLHNNKLATVNLTALANCRGLRSLYLDGNALHENSVMLAPLAACRLLRSLRLGRNRLGGELDISCLLSAAALSTLDVSASVTLVARVTAETSNASSAAAALPPALRRKAASVVWRQDDSLCRMLEPEPKLKVDANDASDPSSAEVPAAPSFFDAMDGNEGLSSVASLPAGQLVATLSSSVLPVPFSSPDGEASTTNRALVRPAESTGDCSLLGEFTSGAGFLPGTGHRADFPSSLRACWTGNLGHTFSSAGSEGMGPADEPLRKVRFCVLLVGFRGTGRYAVEALFGENPDVGTVTVPCAALEARAVLSLVPAHVHVVVVEVGPSSEVLIVALRAVDASVPIVIVGRTDASADAASRCLRRGASCFLTQPLSGRDAITVRSLAQKRARSVPSINPDLSVWAALRPRSSQSLPPSAANELEELRRSGLVETARDIVAGPTFGGTASSPSLVQSAPPSLASSAPCDTSSTPSTGAPPTHGGALRCAPVGCVRASTKPTRVVTKEHTPPSREALPWLGVVVPPPPFRPRTVVDVDFSVLRTRALRLAHGGGSSPNGTSLSARSRVEESALRMLFSRCGGSAGLSAFPSIATLCGLPVCVSDVFFNATRRFAGSSATSTKAATAATAAPFGHGSLPAASRGLGVGGLGGGGDSCGGGQYGCVHGSAAAWSPAARSNPSPSCSSSANPLLKVTTGRPVKECVTYAAFRAFWQEHLRECDAETRLFNVLRESPATPAVASSAVATVVRCLVAARQSRSGVAGSSWRSLPTSRSASPSGGLPPSFSSSNLLSDLSRGFGGGCDTKGRSVGCPLSAVEEADVAVALILYALRGSRWSALRLRDFRRSALCAGLLSAESGVYGGVTASLRSDHILGARNAFVAALAPTDGSYPPPPLYRLHPTLGRVQLLPRLAMVAYNAARGLLTPTAVDALFSCRCPPSRMAQRRRRRIQAAHSVARVSWAAGMAGVVDCCAEVGAAVGHTPLGGGQCSSCPSAQIQGLVDDALLSSSTIVSSSGESYLPVNDDVGLDVAEFAVFWTATQDASTRSAAEYFFDILDVDLDGRLTAVDAAHFYADKRRLMQAEGLEPAEFRDIWLYTTDMMLAASGGAGRSRLTRSGFCSILATHGRVRERELPGFVANTTVSAASTTVVALSTAFSPGLRGSSLPRWRPGPGPSVPRLFPPEASPTFGMAITLPTFRSVAEKDRSDILHALLCREDNGSLVDLRKTSERAADSAAAADADGIDTASTPSTRRRLRSNRAVAGRPAGTGPGPRH